eukprot:jgi/Ulvmu1/2122/UM127_0007.1
MNDGRHIGAFRRNFVITLGVATSVLQKCAAQPGHPRSTINLELGNDSLPGRGLANASNDSAGAHSQSPAAASVPSMDIIKLRIAPANITVVNTAEELQDALLVNEARDVVIQSHLDLTGIVRADTHIFDVKIDIPGHPTNSSLLYATALRSMRGNCSSPDAAAALSISPEGLLPLKPRQCMLLLPDTMLTVTQGAVWVDNVYLKLQRSVWQAEAAFIRAGLAPDREHGVFGGLKDSKTFITNVTFQAELGRSVQGVTTGHEELQVYIEDCIFTDWEGVDSPIVAAERGMVNVVNTVFRNFWLHAPVVDVSIGGVVRFEGSRFAGVKLPFRHGNVVATGISDYTDIPSEFGEVMYLPSDDYEFDVELQYVPPEERGPFGAEYEIEEAEMSDCVYIRQADLMPGCPEEARAAHAALLARGAAHAGSDFFAADGPAPSNDGLPFLDHRFNMTARYQRLVSEQSPWFALTRETLGELPPPPAGWPDFESNIPPVPVRPPPQQPRLWADFKPVAAAPPAGMEPPRVERQSPLGVGLPAAVAAAALLVVVVGVWARLRWGRKRRAREADAAKAAGASRSRSAGNPSSSGRSELSIVQSRKVEVPETTQILILTGNTSHVLPGFTAQANAASTNLCDSPLATEHYPDAPAKLPPLKLLPWSSRATAATLQGQHSLPSAARSASTEPASHSAGSDGMYAVPLATPAGGAVAGSLCASPGGTLSGDNIYWTSPAGMHKTLSGGSPGMHRAAACQRNSLPASAELDSVRLAQEHLDSEVLGLGGGLLGGSGSVPRTPHISDGCCTSGDTGGRPDLTHVMGSMDSWASPAALLRAGSSETTIAMRAPDTVMGLLGLVEAPDSQHTQHDATGVLVEMQHLASRGLAPPQRACTAQHAVSASAEDAHAQAQLQRKRSLAGAWEGVVSHGEHPVRQNGHIASGPEQPQHAQRHCLPCAAGMEAVSQSGSACSATDETVHNPERAHDDEFDMHATWPRDQTATWAGPQAVFQCADSRGTGSVTLQAWDTARSGGPGTSLGIAAQWHGLSRSLRQGGLSRVLRGSGGCSLDEDASMAEHASIHEGPGAEAPQPPRAPPMDVSGMDVAAACVGEHMRRLGRQLDSFGSDDLFLGRFRMLGRDARRLGGQALIQFAEGGADGWPYAIKFFLEAAAFDAETALYAACSATPLLGHRTRSAGGAGLSSAQSLPAGADCGAADSDDVAVSVPVDTVSAQRAQHGRFLPQVEVVCDGGAELVDSRGRPLPPCIVMEKGESLQDWSERASPDMFTALAVVSNLSKRLADMHDAGYVHRDLKPANVMWLPRENRWTVIDFGCAARIGVLAPLHFTLAYAAPEVVHAYEGRQKTVRACPALDAWSLGIVAFELLTGLPAFRMLTDGRRKVLAQLRGDEPLPWEGELERQQDRLLGAFKGPVLQLLQRDPARRISMRRFHDACTKLFASVSTVEA